jgi:hypothetical protein
MTRASIASALLFSVLAAGCGGSEAEQAESSGQISVASTAATTPTTTAETQALVGRWERVNECPQLVKALSEAGLGAIAASVGGDYFPDSTPKELAKKDDLCRGAEPFVHSHFFTETGEFGSLTEDLEQVDDGTYEILDGGRFRIGNADTGVVFRYRIDGDELSLSPVITPQMKREALAHPLRFSDAGWSIAVSYPGHVWKRVDCRGWCPAPS